MDTNKSNSDKKPRQRSPSYPSIDLETSIQKARILKEKGGAGDYFIPFDAAMKFLGYSPKSSNGLLIIAALKKFELIEDKGTGRNREFRLSKLAQTILFYENSAPNSDEYQNPIKEAALNPSIHRELWGEYGNAPSDVLKPYLVLKRTEGTFTEKAADDCIEQYKKTISFAKLIKSDNVSGHSKDKMHQIKEKQMESMPNTIESNEQSYIPQTEGNTKQTLNFPIKLSEKIMVNLQIQHPIEDEDLDKFLSTLEALKPGILQSVLNKHKKKGKEEDR